MRLTNEQKNMIRATLKHYFGHSAKIYIFGSRLNDAAKGGDIDILVESAKSVPLMQRLIAKDTLQNQLFLPVDLLFKQQQNPPTSFQSLAMENAVELSV